MSELNPYDVERVLSVLPKEVVTELLVGGCFLAGGAIRAVISGQPINDIDLFVSSKDAALTLANRLSVSGKTFHRIIDTDNAYTVTTFRVPVQIIHRWVFGSPEECVNSFDFTIACAAIWYQPSVDKSRGEFKSICDEAYYQDLAAKRLVYRNPIRNEDAGGSLLRLLKFYRMGYSAPLKTVADVITRLMSGVDPEKMRTVELPTVLLGLLREVDPSLADRDLFKE